MCSADLTCENGSRIQLVLNANCVLGLTNGFLNKIFKKLSYLVTGHYLCRGGGGKKEGGVRVILDSQEEGVKLFYKEVKGG